MSHSDDWDKDNKDDATLLPKILATTFAFAAIAASGHYLYNRYIQKPAMQEQKCVTLPTITCKDANKLKL